MPFPEGLLSVFLRLHSKNPAPDIRVLWVTLRSGASMWGGGLWELEVTVNHLPHCPSADPRVSSTLADPHGALLPILAPAFTDLARNQILAGCFQSSPCPSNSRPICGSAPFVVFPNSGHPQLDRVAQAKAIPRRLLLTCLSFLPKPESTWQT